MYKQKIQRQDVMGSCLAEGYGTSASNSGEKQNGKLSK